MFHSRNACLVLETAALQKLAGSVVDDCREEYNLQCLTNEPTIKDVSIYCSALKQPCVFVELFLHRKVLIISNLWRCMRKVDIWIQEQEWCCVGLSWSGLFFFLGLQLHNPALKLSISSYLRSLTNPLASQLAPVQWWFKLMFLFCYSRNQDVNIITTWTQTLTSAL